jgi:hypothetical protein
MERRQLFRLLKYKRRKAFYRFALQQAKILGRREDFGLRWQSAAATPLFDCGQSFQSGVALRFPPQSKKYLVVTLLRCAFALKNQPLPPKLT